MYTLEAFVEGTGRVEEEQEKLAIHVESKLILEKVDVSHRTQRGRTFQLERTSYEKELGNHFLKPAGMVQGEQIKLKSWLLEAHRKWGS